MAKKLFIVLAIVFIFSLAFFAIAKAQTQNQAQNEAQNEAQNQGEIQQLQEQNQEQEGEPSLVATPTQAQTQAQNKGQTNAQQHRSTVANFVQELLQVAERQEGGIGEQVRVVAQQQNQSAITTIQAMEKVQTRNKIRIFLFGSDYKNLGALRSEVVHTRNRIEQLNRIMADIENEGDRTEFQNQIQTLEQEQLRIENFIKTEEGKFSLFGWLIKLFNR